MKKFDLEKAKAGAKVCTKLGHPVRILSFEAKGTNFHITGMVDWGPYESPQCWNDAGIGQLGDVPDLMMEDPKPVEVKRWMNINSGGEQFIHETKESAENMAAEMDDLHPEENYIAIAVELTGSYIPKE